MSNSNPLVSYPMGWKHTYGNRRRLVGDGNGGDAVVYRPVGTRRRKEKPPPTNFASVPDVTRNGFDHQIINT